MAKPIHKYKELEVSVSLDRFFSENMLGKINLEDIDHPAIRMEFEVIGNRKLLQAFVDFLHKEFPELEHSFLDSGKE